MAWVEQEEAEAGGGREDDEFGKESDFISKAGLGSIATALTEDVCIYWVEDQMDFRPSSYSIFGVPESCTNALPL